MRSHVEVQIGMIAKGQADKDAVVAHTLQQFRQKFLFFVAKVARMDALFEASFSPLASSGMGQAQPMISAFYQDHSNQVVLVSGPAQPMPGRAVSGGTFLWLQHLSCHKRIQ